MHFNAKNLTGLRFGRLVAVKPTSQRIDGKVVWECNCDCGRTALVDKARKVGATDFNDQIICGDMRDYLPRLESRSIPLIVTDPPYGLNYNNGDLAHKRESAFGGNRDNEKPRPIAGDGEREAHLLFLTFLKEAKRILVKGACCCCCCGGGGPRPLFARWTLMLDRYIGFKQAVVWDKGGLGMGIHYRRNYEFMLVAQNGNPAYCWNGGNTTPNVLRIPKIIPSEHQHPTEKPVALMEYFINLHSNPGDLILDPFAGTGATLVAAKRTGRHYLGFELNPDYCAIAERRLTQEVLICATSNT